MQAALSSITYLVILLKNPFERKNTVFNLNMLKENKLTQFQVFSEKNTKNPKSFMHNVNLSTVTKHHTSVKISNNNRFPTN